MAKFSIIVPVYNIDKYLRRCLSNLIGQTYKDLEIILVNDGSTDDSADICQEFACKDSRIKLLFQENQGLSAARNAGLKQAQGEFIYFVDGDDWLDKDCIEKCEKYLKSSVDIVMFPYKREYEKKSIETMVFQQSYMEFSRQQIKNQLIRRLIGPVDEELCRPDRMEDLNPVWNKIYRADLVKNIKFVDTSIIGTEDLWFNLNVINNARNIIFMKEVKYHYNKENRNSLTRKYNRNLFPGWKTLYEYIKEYIGAYAPDSWNYRKALDNRIVINLLALTRNIILSDLSRKEKREELNILLKDPIYKIAFQGFEYHKLTFVWHLFYKCCRYQKSGLIYYMILAAEKIKTYVK